MATPFRVRESRAPLETRHIDLVGAATATGGVALLVYAISRAPTVGWSSAQTIGVLIAAVAVLAFFVVWEGRQPAPLMPLSVFRIHSVSAANAVAVLLGFTIFATFFLLTLYVQDVLHYSALRTGLTFLVTAGTIVVVAGLAQTATTRLGARSVIVAGMAMLAGGLLWYTQIPVHGRFVGNLLGGYLLVGFGLALAFVAVSIAALSGVGPQVAGLASGLLNTSQQVGGAIGVAVTSSVALSRTDGLLASGHSPADALTQGYALGFWVIAGVTIAGLVLALLTLQPMPHQVGSLDTSRGPDVAPNEFAAPLHQPN
jgi:hypothetical protein